MAPYRSFSGKILLFGEYTILHGSKALAIPIPEYSGKFVEGYDLQVKAYFDWLHQQNLDLDNDLIKKMSNQLTFESNIPMGYGCGSSGALVAATYDLAKKSDKEPTREFLGEMEAFFHGKSSGLDPLVCFNNRSYILHDGKTEEFDWDEELIPEYDLFDSNTARSTNRLVNLYKQKMTKSNFSDAMDYMTELNNQIINRLSANDYVDYELIDRLSVLQREWMEEFIPVDVQETWDKGFETGDHALKLCGAGGGGFFLQFFPDYDEEDE